MELNEKIDTWAILELMGHVKLAGKVSSMTMGATVIIRIDIPETATQPAFTRMFNPSAMYGLTPVTEEIARITAQKMDSKPPIPWEVERAIEKQTRLAAEQMAHDILSQTTETDTQRSMPQMPFPGSYDDDDSYDNDESGWL